MSANSQESRFYFSSLESEAKTHTHKMKTKQYSVQKYTKYLVTTERRWKIQMKLVRLCVVVSEW